MKWSAWLATLAAPVAIASFASPSIAADNACFDNYTEAQRLRRRDELARTKVALQACLAPACPPLLRTDCTAWLAEVEADTPSIRVATDIADPARSATVDGRPVGLGDDVVLDPGPHKIRVETAKGVRETTIELRRREKQRRVVVRFVDDPPPPSAMVTTRPIPTTFWVASAVSLVALGTFGVVGTLGRNEQSSLDDRCAPRCPPEDSDRVSRMYTIADVALGVSIVAAATAAVLLLTRGTVTRPASTK